MTAKCVAAAAWTVMAAVAARMLVESVSETVKVWMPAVFKVMLKTPVPEVSVALAGGVAWPSEMAKWTVPE